MFSRQSFQLLPACPALIRSSAFLLNSPLQHVVPQKYIVRGQCCHGDREHLAEGCSRCGARHMGIKVTGPVVIIQLLVGVGVAAAVSRRVPFIRGQGHCSASSRSGGHSHWGRPAHCPEARPRTAVATRSTVRAPYGVAGGGASGRASGRAPGPPTATFTKHRLAQEGGEQEEHPAGCEHLVHLCRRATIEEYFTKM